MSRTQALLARGLLPGAIALNLLAYGVAVLAHGPVEWVVAGMGCGRGPGNACC